MVMLNLQKLYLVFYKSCLNVSKKVVDM